MKIKKIVKQETRFFLNSEEEPVIIIDNVFLSIPHGQRILIIDGVEYVIDSAKIEIIKGTLRKSIYLKKIENIIYQSVE